MNRPARCGTISGYNRHKRLGEPVDPACAQVNRDRARARHVMIRSGRRLSLQEALAELGLPPDRAGGRPERDTAERQLAEPTGGDQS